MRAIAKDISLRGWLALAATVAAAALLAGDAFTMLTSPRYIEVPLANARDVNDATALLDQRGLRWRLEGDGTLRVEQPRLGEARSVLRRDGVLASPRRVRDELGPEAQYARELQRETNELLTETVGAGRATVAVNVGLDQDRRTERRLRYGKDGKPLTRRVEQWRLTGDFARGRGRYEASERGVDRALRATRFATGGVERVSAALIVDPDLGSRDVRALRRAVASALGIDRRRGDVLRVSRIDVVAPATKAAAGSPGARIEATAPWAVLLVGVAGFLFEVWRCLRRRPREPTDPVWLTPAR